MMRLTLGMCAVVVAAAATAEGFAGKVSYPDGRPVAGAVVYALDAGARLNVHNNTVMTGERVPRAISDRDGRFVFDSVPHVPSLLLAQDMEDAIGVVDVEKIKGAPAVVIQPGATTRIQVRNGPLPVVDEEVRLRLQTPVARVAFEYSATTDADGNVELPAVVPGLYDVSTWQSVPQVGCCFRAVMTRHAESTVVPGQETNVALGGTDLPYLEGLVNDAEGAPLHGVWVRLIPKSGQTGGEVWSTVTDREGRYAIHDVPASEFELRCFRRLALNDGGRTLEAVETVTLRDEGMRTRNERNITIDLEAFKPLVAGADAPPIEHATVDGGRFDLASHRGEWVLVHFFASWCAPCVANIDSYDQIAAALDDSPLTVLGVSLDESADDLDAFLVEHALQHPVVYAGSWSQNAIRKAYRVVSIPTTILISPEGTIDRIDAHGEVLKKYLSERLRVASAPKPPLP